jgi:glutamine cyclotransferase
VVFAEVSVGANVFGLTRNGTLYEVDPAAAGGSAVIHSLTGLVYGNNNYLYGGMTVLNGMIWLTTANGVTEVDPAAAGGPAVVTTVTGIGYPAGIASDGTYLWTTDGGSTIYQIDPNAAGGPAAIASVVVPASGNSMQVDAVASAFGKVWILDSGCGTHCGGSQSIYEIDPAAAGGPAIINTISSLTGLAPYGQTPLVAVGSELWVAQASAHNLVIDPNAVGGPAVTGTVDLPCWTNDMFFDGTDAWASTTNGQNAALAINPTTKTVSKTVIHGFEGLSNPGQMTMVGTDLWVANGTGTISVMDPTDAGGPKLLRTVSIGSNVGAIYFDGTHVWATDDVSQGTLTEIDPAAAGGPSVLKVLSGFNFPSGITSIGSKIWVIDAGFYYDPGCAGIHEIDPNAAGGATETWANCLSGYGKGAMSVFAQGTNLIVGMNGWGDPLVVVDTAATGGPAVVASYPTIYGDQMTFDGTHLWYTTWANPVTTLHEVILDVAHPQDPPVEVQSIPLTSGNSPGSITFDGAHVWVGTGQWLQGYLDEVDAETGTVLQHIDINTQLNGHYTPGYLITDGQYVVGSVSGVAQILAATVPTPLAPQSVSVMPGDGSAQISWDAPSYGGTSPVTGYDVVATPQGDQAPGAPRRGKSALFAAVQHTCSTTGAGGSSCTLSGLQNGTTYSVKVTASNANGNGLFATAAVTPAATPTTTTPTTTPTTMPTVPSTAATPSPSSEETVASLAATGRDVGGMAGMALALLSLGGIALVGRRMRRRRA